MAQLAVRNMFNILIELTQYFFEHVDFQNVEIVNMFNIYPCCWVPGGLLLI